MKVPPEIVLKNVPVTPLVDKLISRGISKFEKVYDRIISVRIALERAQARRQTSNPYRLRIDIRIPDRADIVVTRLSQASRKVPAGLARIKTPSDLENELEPESSLSIKRGSAPKNKRDEPLTRLITQAFDSARRELEKAVDKQRHEVKTPAQSRSEALVNQIFRGQDYGFLRDLDGQAIYFHKNSVLHRHWEKLEPGVMVRYTPELGEKGLQASTVELVDKPGALEMHNRLHDLSVISEI
ncbi:MAG TPA: hypothetical protein VMB24_05445 [Dehalococcoidales bacterium]|nr:hypothetical protein [Dehalococcoidales bacterium]